MALSRGIFTAILNTNMIMALEIRITVHVGYITKIMTVTLKVSQTSKPLSGLFLSFSVVLLNSGDANVPSWGLREVRRCFNEET